MFLGEAEKSVLVMIGSYKIWIPKKFIFKSEYTVIASIGIIAEFTYKDDETDKEISGAELVKILQTMQPKRKH